MGGMLAETRRHQVIHKLLPYLFVLGLLVFILGTRLTFHLFDVFGLFICEDIIYFRLHHDLVHFQMGLPV